MFLNCDTAVLIHFLERLGLVSRSRGVFLERLVSVLKVERLVSVLRFQRVSLVSVLRVWQNGTSRSRLGLEGWPSRSCNLTSCGHPWFQLLTGTSSLRTDRANDYNTQVLHIHTTNGVIQSNKHIQKNMFGNLLFDETVAWVLDKSLRLRRVTWWLQTWHRQHGHMSHGRQMHTCHCCIQPAALVGDSRHTNKHSTDKRPYDNSDNNETFARHMMSAIRRHRKRQEWTGRERTIL